MKLPNLFRSRAWGLPLVALLGVAGAWVASPSLRLVARGTRAASITKAHFVDAHSFDGAWFDAARAGRTDILGALLDAGYPIDAHTSSGYTATILAAYDEQPAALDYLLRRGADACAADRNGNTALMGALYKGELSIARRLLKAACPIDQVNNAGETALSFAVMFGRLDVVPDLVDLGADPSHLDRQGDTPYAVAEKQGNEAAMRVLRKVAPGATPGNVAKRAL
jgi:ankyrin repeat protein